MKVSRSTERHFPIPLPKFEIYFYTTAFYIAFGMTHHSLQRYCLRNHFWFHNFLTARNYSKFLTNDWKTLNLLKDRRYKEASKRWCCYLWWDVFFCRFWFRLWLVVKKNLAKCRKIFTEILSKFVQLRQLQVAMQFCT